MRRYAKLYAAYLRKAFVAFSQFKADAVLSSLSILVRQVAAFMGVWAIVYSVGSLGGWNFYEIALIYAFFLMSRCLSEFLFDSIWNIGNVFVRRGALDMLLVRPAPVFFQLVCNRIEFAGLAGVLAGAVLAAVCMLNLPGVASVGNVLLAVLFVPLGALINSAIYLVFNNLNFWLVQGNDIADLLETAQEFTRYPLGIFPTALSFILTFVLPLAFSSYYPAAYMLGREGPWVLVATPLVTAACWAAGYLVWRAGLRAYDSTGS